MMPSNTRDVGRAYTETSAVGVQALGADRGREEDASTLIDDELDASPNTQRYWSNFQVDDRNTSTVFESWEMISVRPTTELTSFKHILGVNIASTYKVLKDRYTGVRAIPSYSQEDLAHMVAAAESEWTPKKFDRPLFGKQETYSQNLARRIFELPACLPSKLGALLDCRFVATNKNPCIRRDWKVVMLKPMVGFMTGEGQQVHNGGLWGSRQRESIQKWLVIIRGQDTRFSEKGFAIFNTMTNPWLKIDEGLQDDERNASEQHEGAGD
ncbi:hypothetical protein F4782DRAFT_504571 [Xylaria castorea]|nr:hypothetical protein F4782DRAFT_504571 [Xylaria castorea]